MLPPVLNRLLPHSGQLINSSSLVYMGKEVCRGWSKGNKNRAESRNASENGRRVLTHFC